MDSNPRISHTVIASLIISASIITAALLVGRMLEHKGANRWPAAQTLPDPNSQATAVVVGLEGDLRVVLPLLGLKGDTGLVERVLLEPEIREFPRDLKDSIAADPDKYIRLRFPPNTDAAMVEIFSCPSKAEAATLAKAFGWTFAEFARKQGWGGHERRIEQVMQERDALGGQLDRIRVAISRERPLDTGSVAEEQQMRSQDIVAARAQMRQLQAELRGAVVRLKSIDEMSPADLNLQPQVRAAVDADPTMRTLREMLVKATIERDNVAQSERKNFEARLASIRGQMTDREQDVSKGQVSALREQCRDRVEELSHQVLETQSAIDKLQAEFRDLATRNEDIDRLRRQEANLEERIAALDKELLAERLHVTDAPRVYVSPAVPRDLVTTHPARP